MWLKLTGNLKLEPAWIAWHKRVFEAVQTRLVNSGKSQFPYRNLLKCTVRCEVGRNCDISSLHLGKPSGNATFDTMVLEALKSLAHDKVLLFPAGAQAYAVRTTGTFILDPSHNNGRPAVNGDWDLDCLALGPLPFIPPRSLPEEPKNDWAKPGVFWFVR